MSVIRSNFGELLEPGLAYVFLNEYNRYSPEWPTIVKEKQSSKKFEEELELVGLGIMGTKAEGVGVSYEDISQGHKQTYTPPTYAKAIRISMEMYEDDLYDIMNDMTGALARSAMQREEVEAANLLNNAFTGTAGSDGSPLISATHTLSIGGTQSNALTAASDLDASSLQEAIAIIEETKDEKGLNVALKPWKLVVGTRNQWAARELLDSEYKPGTSDNEINAIRGKGLTYVVNHYLTDPDAWYLLADEHKLRRISRIPLSFFKGSDYDTDDCKFKARMRFTTGFGGWRGVTGSAGA